MQRIFNIRCQPQKNDMRSLTTVLIVLVPGILSFACKKELKGDESDLYGTWVKGSNLGDTVWFMRKNGEHIMKVAVSFNAQMPAWSEKEYKYKDGKLSVKSFSPSSQQYFPMNSFAWVETGKEFSITNSELYPFLSSIITFRYRRL